MTRDHPVMGFTRWFAWHRVPVADNKTAWLCWVERGSIFFNGTCAAWAYRLPPKNIEGYVTGIAVVSNPFMDMQRQQPPKA
jgi:hypothetical protein